MKKPIIFIAGGTGVGTSTLSLELAKTLDIQTILSTDIVREILRSVFPKGINPALEHSTYSAGQTDHYQSKSEEVKQSEIIRGYKMQCVPIEIAISGIIRRAVTENVSMIIEGAHLIPGNLRNSDVYNLCQDRLVELLVHLPDEKVHFERLSNRQFQAPERKMDKYSQNFKEIRWIHDYLKQKAARFPEIVCVDNSGSPRGSLDQILTVYYSKK